MRTIDLSIRSLDPDYSSLNDFIEDFKKLAKEFGVDYSGPKITLKRLKIATRKNYSGSGSKTWDRWVRSFYSAKISFKDKKAFLIKMMKISSPKIKLNFKFK